MVRLPPRSREFPKADRPDVPANAWGSQWRYLGFAARRLVRFGKGLRIMNIR